jgi:lysophospholipase L1-like esterase
MIALLVVIFLMHLSAGMADLKILAWGDSLTAGMYREKDFAVLHHPYTISLLTKLQVRLPNASITIVNQGVSGEQVLVSMKDRLERHMNEAENNGTRYNWVLLMAGRSSLIS